MKRRRFLSLAAAFACTPSLSRADTWRGHALGADVSVTLHGPRDLTQKALADVPRLLSDIEQRFSLFRPGSSLSRLNRSGQLRAPDAMMRDLVAQADTAHHLTGGIFDPTIQPVWDALAYGGDVQHARQLVGWQHVKATEKRIKIRNGQALTFNGIAQGFATDAMRNLMQQHGATSALINIGEYAALGGPFTLGLEDPKSGYIGTRTLTDRAVATSSPGAMRLGDHTHILNPKSTPPLWATVNIEADSATLADALSTAAVFMDVPDLQRLKVRASLYRITTVDTDGNVRSL